MRERPPRLWRRVLGLLAAEEDRAFLLGDLDEEFAQRQRDSGQRTARRWYRAQVVRSVPPLLRQRFHRTSPPGAPMSDARADVRFALRLLRSRPGFAAAVILTLATGIGASTAVYGVFTGVFGAPLPYGSPEEVVVLGETREGDVISVAYPNYLSWLELSRSFEDLAAVQFSTAVLQGPGAEPSTARVYRASATLSGTLGVPPLHGRWFTPAEDGPGGEAVVVLAHALWQTRFGGRPDVLGTTVTLDGEPFVVVGVMPPGYTFYARADAWTPIGRLVPGSELEDRRAHPGIRVVGRLRPGVSLAAAREDMGAVAGRLAETYPASNADMGVHMVSLREQLVGDGSERMGLLVAGVALLLLIASLNAAVLLSARTAERRSEMAVRAALGAGGRRLGRQLLTESAVLAVLAGGGGVLVAWALVRVAQTADPTALPGLGAVRLEGDVLLFALVIATAVALTFGAAPAVQALRRGQTGALREARSAGGGLALRRARRGMVALQVALSVMLVGAAALLGRTFLSLRAAPLGLDDADVLTFAVELPDAAYAEDHRRVDFYRELLGRVASLPGVRSAATVNPLPLGGSDRQNSYWVEGRPYTSTQDLVRVDYAFVSPGYFASLHIPVLRGRDFDPTAEGTATEVVVDEALADRLWPGQNPLGRTLQSGGPESDSPRLTVVGVVGSVRQYGPGQPPPGMAYLSAWQLPFMGTTVVRTEGQAMALMPAIRAIVHELEPEAPVEDAQLLSDYLADNLSRPRFAAAVLGLFAGAALLLAVFGVHGVAAFEVAGREREIAVRMALGARGGRVLGEVLAGAGGAVAGGAGLGVLAFLAGARLLRASVPDMPAADPAVLAAVVLVLVAAGFVGALLPALRAAGVAPATALRGE